MRPGLLMPQVNLSTLSGVELRQLLDASRRRGDAALSYKVLQEMAVRRDAPAGRRGLVTRGVEEPRHIEVELGEPAQDDDLPPMPNWRPPAREDIDAAASPAPGEASDRGRGRRKAQAAAEAASEATMAAEDIDAAPPALDANRPLSLWDDDPAPFEDEAVDGGGEDLRMSRAPAGPPKPAYRPGLRLVVGFALGITVGTALGFWVGEMPRDTPARAAPAATPMQTAALAPPPAPIPEPPAPIPAATPPTPDAAPEAAAETPATPPSAQDAAGDANSRAAEPPPLAPQAEEAARSAPIAQRAPERPAAANGCADEPTPADRAICGDRRLRRLQGELRQAYAEALEAHQDRTLLRERQLAWRDARNAVTDPTRLAQLYEARIRKLNAATAEALRAR